MVKMHTKYWRNLSSKNQKKQKLKKINLTSFSRRYAIKKDTDTRVESKSKVQKVKTLFSGLFKSWLKIR